jgi:hypothetical protein
MPHAILIKRTNKKDEQANQHLRGYTRVLEGDPQLKKRLREHVLTEAVPALPAAVEDVRRQVRAQAATLDRRDSRVGNAAGNLYEERAAHRAVSRVQALRIERSRLVLAPGNHVHPSTTPWQ